MSIDKLIERANRVSRALITTDDPTVVDELLSALSSTQAEILRLKAQVDKLTADLAFADEHSAKVEALLEPHIVWTNPAPDAAARSLSQDGEEGA